MGKGGIMFVFGFLFNVTGKSIVKEGQYFPKDCDSLQFAQCLQEVTSLEQENFNITSAEQLKEVCNSKQQAVQCTSNLIDDCLRKGERDLYEATARGKLKVIQEMCTEGSAINKGYLQNTDCWGKLGDEIDFCNDKFAEYERALLKSDMEDTLKMFFECCNFEWYKNCLDKIAQAKCSDHVAQLLYNVTTLLEGTTVKQICSTSYSNCHILYDIYQQELEGKLKNISNVSKANLNSVIMQFVIMAFFMLVPL